MDIETVRNIAFWSLIFTICFVAMTRALFRQAQGKGVNNEVVLALFFAGFASISAGVFTVFGLMYLGGLVIK